MRIILLLILMVTTNISHSTLIMPIKRVVNQNITRILSEYPDAVTAVNELKEHMENIEPIIRSHSLFHRFSMLDSNNREYKIVNGGHQLTLTEDNTVNGIMGYNLNNNTFVITDTRRFYNGSENTNRYIFINVGNDNNIILSPRSRGVVLERFNNYGSSGSAISCNNLTTIGLLMFRNCSSSSSNGSGDCSGGAICCNIFTMNQGSIEAINNNSGSGRGGAICCENTFTMNGGSVMKLNNNNSNDGGAIWCQSLTMNQGSIEANNNNSNMGGGAIRCATLTMNQGSIMKLIGNISLNGGAIWCQSFTMNQGFIEAIGNIGSGNHGGGAICCEGTFTMNQGYIKAIGNSSSWSGGAIWCNNSITLTTEGNISFVRDPSNYEDLKDIASVYFYGNRDRGNSDNRPNDIYSENNITINGNGICAMYGGVRGGKSIIKDGKGLYILGNIGDMNNPHITINDGVICILATINDLNRYKGTVTIGTTGNPKLVIWLAKGNNYEYRLEYWETPEDAREVIDGATPSPNSLLAWMKNPDNANSYLLQRMS